MEVNYLIADIPQKAIIEHGGKILIVQDDKGKWQLPGGRLHIGEQPVEGLKREIKEELDVEIEPIRIFDIFVFTSASGRSHFVVVWICKLFGSGENIKSGHEEVRDFKWVSSAMELDELQEDTRRYPMWQEYKETLKKFFTT